MRKRLSIWLTLAVLLAACCPFTARAIQDSTPPVLLSLSADKTRVEYPGQITFTARASDDISGPARINLWVTDADGRPYDTSIALIPAGDDRFSYVYDIPANMAAGTWRVSTVEVEDHAGNRQTYGSGQAQQLPAAIAFEVVRPETHTDIRMISAALSAQSVAYGDKVRLSVEIETQLKVTEIQAMYFFNDSDITFNLKPSGGVYTAEFDTHQLSPYIGSYIPILTARVGDNTYLNVLMSEEQRQALTLTLKQVQQAPALPEVTAITVDKTAVKTPAVVTYAISFDPMQPVVSAMQFDFQFIPEADKDHPYAVEGGIMSGSPTYDKASGRYLFRLEIPADAKPGYYLLYRAFLTGLNGQPETYITPGYRAYREQTYPSQDGALYGQLPETPLIQVTPGVQGDVNAGTLGDDYVKKIQQAADGSVIAVDTSQVHTIRKEAFEAIRGTSKTLLLENAGIQWIFQGADVCHPAIELDTGLFIERLDTPTDQQTRILSEMMGDSPALAIHFPPNGLLPGKATVKIKADYTFRQYVGVKDLYLYYYNDAACELDLVRQKLEISSDGYYVFEITHNSTYMLSAHAAAPRYVSQKTGGQSDGSGKKVAAAVQAKGTSAHPTAEVTIPSAGGTRLTDGGTPSGTAAGTRPTASAEILPGKSFPLFPVIALCGAVLLLAAAGLLYWKRAAVRRWWAGHHGGGGADRPQ